MRRRDELMWQPIVYVERLFEAEDLASVVIGGWTYEGAIGLFDSHVSAMADQSGCWDEYCEWHRSKR
jgi:hypothetical protein